MKICCTFEIENARKAGNALDCEVIERYGDTCEGHPLFCWDSGSRRLVRCRKCGALLLVQSSEYHGFGDDYYVDYFPVESREQALQFNCEWDGFALEQNYEGVYLMQTNDKFSWRNRKKS